MTTRAWLGADLEEVAARRVLDAAGILFAEAGGALVSMTDVARAAGCSRATLYRYFPGRDALRAAFVDREAQRIGRRVAAETAAIADPAARTIEAITSAVRQVRRDPALGAWFAPGSAGMAGTVAQSPAIEAMVAAFVDGTADIDARQRGRWIVRVIVSLLTMPGQSVDEERAMIERFVVPVVLAPARERRGGQPPPRRSR